MLPFWHWGNHMIAPVQVKQPWRFGSMNQSDSLKVFHNHNKTKQTQTVSIADSYAVLSYYHMINRHPIAPVWGQGIYCEHEM